MSDYLVTDTELTSVADAIRTKGGTSADLSFPTGFVSAINDIGGSSYTLIASKEYTTSTTSASSATVDTITTPTMNLDTVLYIRIRDKAGKRNGYFYGTDNYLFPTNYIESPSGPAAISLRYMDANGRYRTKGNYAYGIYVSAFGATSITISKRYSSSYGTVDGTFKVDIYKLEMPDGESPWA